MERDFTPDPLPAASAASPRPLRILVATHNLNFEGAPWFIFELARHLAAQPGVSVRVVSPQEGPMRRVFAEAGMPVEVLDLSAALRTESSGDFFAALGERIELTHNASDRANLRCTASSSLARCFTTAWAAAVSL